MNEGDDRPDGPGGGRAGRPETGRLRWRLWAALGIAFAAGGVAGGLIAPAAASSGRPADRSSSDAVAASPAAACPVASVADRVLPSVVTITVSGTSGSGTGSGEVIKSDGNILTNNHVIAPAASGGSIEVQFADGTKAPATITGRDPLTDLAVIKVQGERDLKPIALGSSGSVHVGDPVIAVGAPLGLSGTVTSGIISATDRTVEVPGENDRSALLVSALQTDAAINPGNSGGALVNCQAQLIGVPTAGASVPSSPGESSGGNIGLGFAIPVNVAKTISDEIIAKGRATHSYFGLQTAPIAPAAAAQARVPEGLYVAGVASGGPAARAGLRPGDVITKVDGQAATSNVQLQEVTLTKKPGAKVPLDYTRDGKRASTSVTLGAQP